jgi:hypothetical protein
MLKQLFVKYPLYNLQGVSNKFRVKKNEKCDMNTAVTRLRMKIIGDSL